jgi:hypothetical protein
MMELDMPGRWITEKQVKLYMESRQCGQTQKVCAARAGISERSGRNIEKGHRQNPKVTNRVWRTRKDPLAIVWESDLVPMLQASPKLKAITLLEYLQDQYPGHYEHHLLRTLQRRVKHWRAISGPNKEVMFRQIHPPGVQGLSDFTQLKGTTITIGGVAFKHCLYHFRLAYSGFSDMRVTIGGESYSALAQGLDRALNKLGGVPKEHRTDSLSAAFRNIDDAAVDDITLRYKQLCQHYDMKATRNNRGKGHENGSVESSHGHLKRRIEQALMLRDSQDFNSVEAYQDFVDQVVLRHNRNHHTKINHERAYLHALPKHRAVLYSERRATVSSTSTIQVHRVTYTVPSRLIGETLLVRLYDEQLICYLGATQVITLQRIYARNKNVTARQVDYRHVIDSLVKKPGAFCGCQYRDDLFPDSNYRAIWTYVRAHLSLKKANQFMVQLLYLAAKTDCETQLGIHVYQKIQQEDLPTLSALQKRFNKQDAPVIQIHHHNLESYDQLIIRRVV